MTGRNKQPFLLNENVSKKITSAESTEEVALYLFVSIDLVNSTKYKTNSKNQDKWVKKFLQFYSLMKEKFCERDKEVTSSSDKPYSLWKLVGDEVLLYKKITHTNELINNIELCSQILKIFSSHVDYIETILDIKIVTWIAPIRSGNIYKLSQKVNGYAVRNVKISHFKEYVDDSKQCEQIDFLGPDIDLGFRIAKGAYRQQIVVNCDYVCLLAKIFSTTESDIENYKIVGYLEHKGVDDFNLYPVIWYYHDWENIVGKQYKYYEYETNEFLKNIKYLKYNKTKCSEFETINNDNHRDKEYIGFLEKLIPNKP